MANFTGDGANNIFTGGSDPDTATGGGGNDQLSGNGGADSLTGDGGSDTLDGGDGDDRLFSHSIDATFLGGLVRGISYDVFAEADILSGGAGDDYIFAGYGDTIDGGTNTGFGDRLFISFLGATSGVSADFRLLWTQDSMTVGTTTISNIDNIGYLEGSNFDDFLVAIDTYYPSGGNVYGRGGNDHILADYYTGWAGSGLYGGDGDDIVDGRGAQYGGTVYGEAGNDTLYTSATGGHAEGGDGNDTIYADNNTYGQARGDGGDDTIYIRGTAYGGDGNDLIISTEGNGFAFSGTLYGEAGDDEIQASINGIAASGGAGADILTGNAGSDTFASGDFLSMSTTPADDIGTEIDILTGAGGNDRLAIGYGDSADGGADSDTLRLSLAGAAAGVILDTASLFGPTPYLLGGGTIQNMEIVEYLRGSEHDDTISVATQATLLTISAGGGNDVITSNNSSVSVTGGDGNDRLVSGAAGDFFDGGDGLDIVDYANNATGVTITAGGSTTWAGAGGDQLTSVEAVRGSAHADTLTSLDGVALEGAGGNDTLIGGTGLNLLHGGNGDDTLVISQNGSGDALDGGAGFDTLELRPVSGLPAGTFTYFNFIGRQPSGIERLVYASAADSGVWAAFRLDQVTNQPGGGQLTHVTGGAGLDMLYLIGIFGTSFEMPDFALDNWNSSDAPDLSGDVVTLSAASAATLIAREGLASTQHLIGSLGNDVLVGSSGADRLEGWSGADTLNGMGGNDTLIVANRTSGGTTSGYTGAGSTFDGGSGTDYLHFAGPVNFQGTVLNVEGIYLAPVEAPALPNGTSVTMSASTFAAFGTAVTLAGAGTLTISLAGGETFNGTGIAHGTGSDVRLFVNGSASNDTLVADSGTTVFNGGAGNDVLYFGAFLSSGDVADGGADTDALVLQGNYSAGYTFSSGNIANIESISVQTGAQARWGDTANNRYDYNLTSVDANVAAGMQLIVNGQSLLAGEDLTFNGSAETDGRFVFYGGHGTDTLTGGGQSDVFFFEGTRWGAGDTVHGGASNDALVLACGNGLNTFVFTDTSFTSIEAISVNNRFATDPSQVPSYSLTLANGNVAPGGTLIVNGNSLAAGQALTVNGSAVVGGNLTLFGGAGGDNLTGGAGNDLIHGGAGADFVAGGAGNDTFRYDAIAHSSLGSADLVTDFALGDLIDLSRIDANSLAEGDQGFAFIGEGIFTGAGAASAGELRAQLLGGPAWLVQGDTDGNGTVDFELYINVTDADPITAGDFVL